MSRLIDADALEVVTAKVPKGMDAKSYMAGMEYVLSQIDALPTIEERKTGKWLPDCEYDGEDEWCFYTCSCCEYQSDDQFNYCPNCGAYMRGEEHDGNRKK